MRPSFFIMTFLVLSVNALTSSPALAKDPAPAKDKAPAKGGIPSMPSLSQHYVHRWIEFPTVRGRNPQTGETLSFSPRPGRAMVVTFLASWCLPCQQLINRLKQLEQKFESRYTDFVYVFAHDTEPDALGFIGTYKLKNNVILGSAPLLESFHQPELPSIYVADRFRWMVFRALETKPEDIEELDRFLDVHTGF
jgi:thiol-disulfide isomerase/thioredoxin